MPEDATPQGWLDQLSQSMWSKDPLTREQDDVDDEIETEDFEHRDMVSEESMKLSSSLRRTSRETPLDISPSGRLYQSIQHSQMVISRPTSTTGLRVSTWNISQNPLIKHQEPLSLRWTRASQQLRLLPQSIDFPSRKTGGTPGQRHISMGSSQGKPHQISVDSSMRRQPRLQNRPECSTSPTMYT
nr:P4 [Strawberry polerovirus 1]